MTVEDNKDIEPNPTVAFDHHAPELAADPYPAYAQLRSRCPVSWSTEYGGFWVLSDYASVREAASKDSIFRSAPSTAIPSHPGGVRMIPIDFDAPESTQFRRILLPSFSPNAVEKLAPWIRQVTDDLVNAFASSGRADLVADYATPIPAIVSKRLLGLSKDWSWYVERVHASIDNMASDPEASEQASADLAASVVEEIAERRANGLRDDLISQIMQGAVTGRPLTDEEVVNYVVLVIIAGLDTTGGALANALIVLDREPELRQRLIDRPDDIPAAVEEFLRYDATITGVARHVSQEVLLGGQQLREGDRVLLMLAAANRDPAEFPEPDAIDIDRPANKHMSFAAGLHRCLGVYLARVMLREGLRTLLARIPDYRIVADPATLRKPDVGVVYALASLPVEFSR